MLVSRNPAKNSTHANPIMAPLIISGMFSFLRHSLTVSPLRITTVSKIGSAISARENESNSEDIGMFRTKIPNDPHKAMTAISISL